MFVMVKEVLRTGSKKLQAGGLELYFGRENATKALSAVAVLPQLPAHRSKCRILPILSFNGSLSKERKSVWT